MYVYSHKLGPGYLLTGLWFVYLFICPKAETFLSLLCMFWLLGVEQLNPRLQPSSYIIFDPCLRLGQQFRIPERSQTEHYLMGLMQRVLLVLKHKHV